MLKINKTAAFKVGKAVIIEGVKSVAIGAAITVATTAITKGIPAAKSITLDDILSGGIKDGTN